MVSIGVSKLLHDEALPPAEAAKTILDAVGDISDMDLFGVNVLIGTYIRPKKTKGGVILTEKFRDEDLYQGKVGLVLKVAEGAFTDGDDADTKFNGKKVKPGDWVFYSVQDGWSLSVNGHHCRMLEDVHIRGTLPGPNMVL